MASFPRYWILKILGNFGNLGRVHRSEETTYYARLVYLEIDVKSKCIYIILLIVSALVTSD